MKFYIFVSIYIVDIVLNKSSFVCYYPPIQQNIICFITGSVETISKRSHSYDINLRDIVEYKLKVRMGGGQDPIEFLLNSISRGKFENKSNIADTTITVVKEKNKKIEKEIEMDFCEYQNFLDVYYKNLNKPVIKESNTWDNEVVCQTVGEVVE